MFNKASKGFVFKTFVMIACLLVGISLPMVFQNSNGDNKQAFASMNSYIATGEEVYSVNLDNEKPNTFDDYSISSFAADKPYKWVYDNGNEVSSSELSDLPYNSTIRVNGEYLMIVRASANPETIIICAEPDRGYKIKGYKVAVKNMSDVSLVNGVTHKVQDLDPNFTGEISIKVETELEEYDFFVGYRYNAYNNYSVEHRAYTVNDYSELLKPVSGSSTKHFKYWILDLAAAEEYYGSNVNYTGSYVELWTGDVGNETSYLKFSYGDNAGDLYHDIDIVAGSGDNAFFGSMLGTVGDHEESPIIYAAWSNVYTFVVDNTVAASGYWSDYGLTMYGASGSEDGDSNNDTVTFSICDNSSYAYPLDLTTKKLAFDLQPQFKVSGYNRYFSLYNYGHYIDDFSISVEGISGDWSGYANTQMLARALDERFYGREVNAPTITLTPSWTAANINVYYSTNTSVNDSVTFGEEYSLDTLIDYQSADPSTTLFSFTAGSSLISPNGIWNYLSIDSYATTGYASTYTLAVDEVRLNNIFKVSLDSIVEHEDGGILLTEDSDYKFYSSEYVDRESITCLGSFDTYSFVPWDNGSYPLIDNYIKVLNDLKTLYKKATDMDKSQDFSCFYNIYFDPGWLDASKTRLTGAEDVWIYLTCNEKVYTLPAFKNQYRELVFWQDGAETAYKSDRYERSKSATTGEYENEVAGYDISEDYVYNENLVLTPYYMYILNLYNTYATNDAYKRIDASAYSPITQLSFSDVQPLFTPSGRTFKGWIFDTTVAVEKDYDYSYYDATNKLLRVTFKVDEVNYEVTFSVYDVSYDSRLYYINAVQGDAFPQDASNPIIKAIFTSSYNLKIDNSISYWNDFNETKDVSDLYGAVSNADIEEADNFKTVQFTISDLASSQFGFMTSSKNSTHYAFYKKADFADSDKITVSGKNYYVYNYGHYITGWTITIKYAAGDEYLSSNGSKFSFAEDSAVENTNSSLSKMNFAMMARSINERAFMENSSELPDIVIVPKWEETQVSVYDTYNSKYVASNLVFGTSKYEWGYSGSVNLGQTFFAYSYDGGSSLISVKGIWNYRNIPHGEFESSDGMEFTLNVTPDFLNDIFKLSLENIKPNTLLDGVTYELKDGTYKFNIVDNLVHEKADVYNFKTYSTTENPRDGYLYVEYNNESLIDSYVDSTLQHCKSAYNSGIQMNFSIFKQVYFDHGTITPDFKTLTGADNIWIYLAHDQAAEVPTFNCEKYYLNTAWKFGTNVLTTSDYDSSKYSSDLTGNSLTKRTEWTAGSGTTLSGHYMYLLPLYKNRTDNSVYQLVSAYSKHVSLDFSDKNYPDYGSYLFKKWVFDVAQAVIDGYEVNYNGGDTLTVTKDGLTTYLTVDGQNQYNEETNGKVETGYYYVTKIQGDLLHNFDAPSTRALLYAYWANEYSATISNTASYWYDVDNENSTLYGAYAFSSGVKVDSEDIYSTTLKIADKVGYEYAFINSEQGITTGLSFLHNSDWKSSNRISCNAGEYYVFSYGQYLSGWIISILVSDGEEETKLWYNGSSWVATETIWDTDDIDDKTMDQLAHDVDELLLDYESFTQLTLVPQWKNVKVKVLLHQDYRKGVNDVLASSITFANPNKYTFANIAKLDTAKSIMAYYYGESENNLISDAAIWNYRNIPYSVFETYSRTGSEIGSGTYTITLKPVYVDDIFRVELIEARMTRPNEYLLSNCDYVFNNNVGLYAEKIRLSYKDKVDANYNFTAYNNEALVDTYITNTLSVCLNSYKAGIQLDNPECFDIFKKVYYIADDVALHSADVENDTLFVTDAVLEPPKFYIYLANNQYTGMMPVFKSTFYSLMFWQNTDRNKSNGSKYNIYPTAEFTAEDFDETMQNQYIIHKDGDNLSYIWNYEDGYDSSSKEVTLTPYYLRKVYTLDIETISKNTGNVERRGYVRVKSEDTVWQEGQDPAENGSLDCIFIYNYDTGTMEIYNWSDGMNLTTCTDYINGTNKVSGFQIFAGCTVTLTVYDQSKDIVAMNTANYDDMIGFKFSKELSQAPKELFEEAVDGNDYQYKMTAEEIEGKHFKNHEAFEIDVCFERIVYSLTAEIDKVKAGGFAIQQNGGTKQYKTRTTINTVAVQNSYLIDYYAYAGFKLQNNAFIYYNGASEGVALLTYNEGEAIVNDRSAQSYRMTKRYYGNNTLDGTWLREYFYSAYTDYDVENTTLGLITINTDAIVFDYAVKVRDESDVSLRENAYILEVPDDYKTTFSLDRDSGKGLTPEMSTYVTDENLGFYYYNSLSDVDYALISSKLHYPANPTANDDCLFATYSFLLTEQPINQYEIMSTHIGRMVENFEEGKIISFDDRQLYFVLEVRKLFTVQMAVEVSEHDTNSTTRTTKLQNGNNNEVEIIINGTATISNVEGKDYYLNSNNTINVTAYSYFGLNNVLTSEFDTKRYSSVSYLRKFTDGVDEYESNESDGAFVTEQNCEVYIKYIPSNLKVEFEYYLEGTFLDSPDDVALYLNDNNIHKPNDENTYYIGDTVSYMVERVNQDYNLKVTINGTVMGTTTLTESIIKCLEENGNLYTVGDRDFDIGVIKIVVDILEKSKSPITVSYQLLSVTQRFADDDYGTFDLFENDTEILSDVNSASTPIIEGRDVFVKLQLPLGYEYVGIKYNYNDYQVVEPDVDGKIKLVGDYDPLTNYGSYKIIIKKLPITAVLDASNVNALSRYKMNGQSMLENLYVGSIINFSSDPAQQERLDYFYYKTLGDDVVIDGMSIKITSEMLGQVGSTYLNFGVAVINRYKLDLVVKGRDYLAEEYPQVENITANNNYKFTRSWDAANKILTLTGEYVDVNTELKVNILSLVTGKYNISFNGNVSDTVSEQLAPLTEDTSYQIIVEPKTYEILRAENLYSNLSQVLDPDNNPLDVIDEVNHVNDIQSVTPKYNQQITISFARTTLDRELATLYISGNDETDTFVVKFNGQIFEAYKVLEDDQLEFIDNFESYGYKIKVLENTRVEMTYTTYNTINLRFDYKLYKYITS